MPELAPDAHAPAAPMLHNKSVRAMGLSVAMKVSSERFMSSASRSLTRLGSGRDKTAWTARLPTMRREVKVYMTGWYNVQVRLKELHGAGMSAEKTEES